jgi:hypothetical protein
MAQIVDKRRRIGGPFPGTPQERDALLTAVERACACAAGSTTTGNRRVLCGAHALLLNEASLKVLIFYRRWRQALERGEWLQHPAWTQLPDLGPVLAPTSTSDAG